MDKFNKLYEEVVAKIDDDQIHEALLRPFLQKELDLEIIKHILPNVKMVISDKQYNSSVSGPIERQKKEIQKALNNISDYTEIIDKFNNLYNPKFKLKEKELDRNLTKIGSKPARYLLGLLRQSKTDTLKAPSKSTISVKS